MQQTFKTNVYSISRLLLILFIIFTASSAFCNGDDLSIVFKADHKDWIYKTGEKPIFTVAVFNNGKEVNNLKLKYTIGQEKMQLLKSDSATLTTNTFVLPSYTMHTPGFLRYTVIAEVNGAKVKGLITAAFSPESINPTIQLPQDFNQFWQNARQSLSRIPMDVRKELLTAYSTDKVDVYQVSFQNINQSRIYGILSVPKKEGKYPAALKVPGAGVRGYRGDVSLASEGVITLEIGIHGVPVIQDPEIYKNLGSGALNGYPSINLDNRDNYYYKRVYLGCIRALDFLVAHHAYDGKNLAVYGGSQGGALSIVTAALDQRVKYLAVNYPALCDVTGYLHNRAGGWPHLFAGNNMANNNKPDKLLTCQYYDVVNFAKQLRVPGFYSWGFNDETCPPTSMYAAYNSISSPKELAIYKETGHNTVPEQRDKMTSWILSMLKQQ
ncbi:acetylxylan esterase [Pedobacter psychroterrae]|uniref:Acetylxylan esterase n=1 Tax=Pedobacter psychroterrae TaxID=2530453 RepID=A0A4R0N8S8_9SPHI|nr:acetylxylan esterase [Pedobacter psychroterrae]TCC96425.1 acetylxylan esterase [Pedobacter psychroterrae]